MRTYATYFTYEKVLLVLMTKRLALAAKRHEVLFLNNINHRDSKSKGDAETEQIISEMFPPRKDWIRFNLDYRKDFEGDIGKMQFEELRLTILKERGRAKKTNIIPNWLVNLDSFVEQVRSLMMDLKTVSLMRPSSQSYMLKDARTKEFRVIVHYNLVNSIISTLVAQYLTDHTDTSLSQPYFYSYSYAFRSSRIGAKAPGEYTYHAATRHIEEYRLANIGKGIYVAEIDLAKFFDTISHKVILSCFDLLQSFFKLNNKPVDERAIQIAQNYLKAFSFNMDALPNEIPGKLIFKWPADKLAGMGVNIKNDPHGVPQGGALSCFFANLILHELDKIFSVEDKELKYLRYCDDFIVLHTDKEKCVEYVEKALDKLKTLYLVAHSPFDYNLKDYRNKIIKKGGTRLINEFWNSSKSKQPYRWGPHSEEGKDNVPYVSFVGYQRRYDGILRVRKKSLKKEYGKQKKLIDDVLRRSASGTNINAKQIVFRTEQKLIAMSVGKKNIFNVSRQLGFCWCAGFKELYSGEKLETQLKYLDKSRGIQMARLRRKLKKLKIPARKGKVEDIKHLLYKPLLSYYHYFNR
jgi:hypothetical protein